MRYVFFGTPQFAAIVLEKLIEADMAPGLVVTNPDRPVGRKKIMTAPAVKEMVLRYKIPVIQPEKLTTKNPAEGGVRSDRVQTSELSIPDSSVFKRNKKSTHLSTRDEPGGGFAPPDHGILSPDLHSIPGPQDLLYQKKWDFFLVVAYGKIIPKEVLEVPRLGTINIHPSLLPKYRGPTPIQTAILNGDEETGVSLMLLDEEVDHGSLLLQRKHEIRNSKFETLSGDLAELGAEMLIESLPKYLNGEITPKEQDHDKATFTKKFTVEDSEVEYETLARAISGGAPEEAMKIDRMVRALNPEPGVWTMTDDSPILDLPKQKRVKILEAVVEDGKLVLKKIQVEGKQIRDV